MKATSAIRILLLLALLLGAGYAGWQLLPSGVALADAQASITISQPDGVDDVLAEGDDFATTVLGDPWDMNEHTDVMAYHGLDNPSFSGGQLTFTLRDRVTLLRILFPGLKNRVDVGKIGMNYPIDTSRYRWLSFRMYQSQGGTSRIKWFYDRYAQPDREYVRTDVFTTEGGWHTYIIDLKNVGIDQWNGSRSDWSGWVRELDIQFSPSDGTQVTVDWVRLTDDNPAGNSLNIAWSNFSSPGESVSFYLDTNTSGCDGPLIHVEENASSSGSFVWQQAVWQMGSPQDSSFSPANVAPGSYYVCARDSTGIIGWSPGQLTVNQAPVVHLTQPGFASGPDYASDGGNAWDMSDAADVDHVVGGSASFSGGNLRVRVPAGESDMQVHLALPGGAIDSSRYHYLTYRLLFDCNYTLSDPSGQETRVFWGRAPNTEATSDLIYDYPGWHTYSVDLRSLPLDSGPTWLTDDWSIFRIDPIGINGCGNTNVYIDDVKLAGDEEADHALDVRWELSDPDTTATTMTLYYDSDQSGYDGTPIATLTLDNGEQIGGTALADRSEPALRATDGLTHTVFLPHVTRAWSAPCSGACYTWYTSETTEGVYYIYACVDDGYNEQCRYSETPVYIQH